MYFQNALSNFIFDVACGGAIRHLAAQGYTSRQIASQLSFPTPYERVREAVTNYFLEEGILLRREPVEGERQEKYIYVQDHGKYGRTSFRRVPARQAAQQAQLQRDGAADAGTWTGRGKSACGGDWTERSVSCAALAERLRSPDGGEAAGKKTAGKAYAACDFGRTGTEFEGFETLDERQREYLQGIAWNICAQGGRPAYHLLNDRMRGIVLRLCESGDWRGKIYLEDSREILVPTAYAERNDTGTAEAEKKDHGTADVEMRDGFV